MKHFQITNKGFSLIELIIAMAIIAILSSAIWGNFFTSLTKGKDSRRKQDLQSVAKALDIYFQDLKAYPTSTLPNWGSAFANPINSSVIYMQKLPNDPIFPSQNYCYESDDLHSLTAGTYYRLYAKLENTSDPNIIATTVCGGTDYNYGISSTNTSP